MEVTIFSDMYTYLDAQFASLIAERSANVIAAVRPALILALTLYIVLYGWSILAGSISEPIMDFIMRAVKLLFVVAIATGPFFSEFVSGPLFTGIPQWLSGAVSGGEPASAGQPFDAYVSGAFYLWDELTKRNMLELIPDVGKSVVGAAMIVVVVLSAAIGFGIFLIAKFALAILVILAPIFIACLVFEPSRRFFYGWLSQAVNYLLLYVIIIVVTSLIIDFTNAQALTGVSAVDPVLRALLLIAVALLGTIFFLQVPNLAGGIAGGAAAGLGDFARSAGAALQGAKSLGGGGSGGGGGGSRGGGSVQKS